MKFRSSKPPHRMVDIGHTRAIPKFTIKRQAKQRRRAMEALAEREQKIIERWPACVPSAVPRVQRGWRLTYSDGSHDLYVKRSEIRNHYEKGGGGFLNRGPKSHLTSAERVWCIDVLFIEQHATATGRLVPQRRAESFTHASLLVITGMRRGIEFHYVRAQMLGQLE